MFSNVVLFVYDFDGVLTDNTVYVDQNGIETVRVNRADGLAISMLKNEGRTQLILSTETNPVVSKRAEKLGIPVVQGSETKKHIRVNALSPGGVQTNQDPEFVKRLDTANPNGTHGASRRLSGSACVFVV